MFFFFFIDVPFITSIMVELSVVYQYIQNTHKQHQIKLWDIKRRLKKLDWVGLIDNKSSTD